jgi:DNA-binding response OmpR family regulator
MTPRVLVVDDSLTVRMDLQHAFEAHGFEVACCSTLEQARAALVDAWSIVILDVLLPDGDGLALLEELRSTASTATVPVVLLSTEAEVRDRIRGLRGGADEYVGKPYDVSDLIARTRVLLRDRAGAEHDPRPRILLVDDSLTFRAALAEQLEAAGLATVQAVSGEDGLRRAEELHPDAIIVDGIMPGMDGPTLVRRIRLDPALRSTPCLLLTASEGSASEVESLDAGADGYARKSDAPSIILARLSAMLRTAEHSRERHKEVTRSAAKRVLAVDDSITYLEMLAATLLLDGYEVVKARSGEEALELLSVQQVDCILLDRMMPGMSGTEVCTRIKASPLRHIPLIMLTARDEREDVVEGINAGADDYVPKSADFDVVRARLRAQLRRKQFEDENRRVREELLQRQSEVRAAHELAHARKALLDELAIKNEELLLLNEELKSFAYTVSHDLRQPLRGMDGFSQALLERYSDAFDEQGRHYLNRIRANAVRMGNLIDGLLGLSHVTRKELQREPVRLDSLAREIALQLRDQQPEREVSFAVAEGLEVVADRQLLASALENLLGNAWKFTAGCKPARIELGVQEVDDQRVFFVRDNGVGFDMAYSNKLFGPFQRLHAVEEFAGTGIGLATVHRIVQRHRGRIWATSEVGAGATFFFTLGAEIREEAS